MRSADRAISLAQAALPHPRRLSDSILRHRENPKTLHLRNAAVIRVNSPADFRVLTWTEYSQRGTRQRHLAASLEWRRAPVLTINLKAPGSACPGTPMMVYAGVQPAATCHSGAVWSRPGARATNPRIVMAGLIVTDAVAPPSFETSISTNEQSSTIKKKSFAMHSSKA